MNCIALRLLAGTSLLALTGAASAADLAVKARPLPPPVFTWTGFYIGGNVGYAWRDEDVASLFTCPAGGGCSVTVPANLANINAAANGTISAKGFTGGVQAGFNWQINALVFGVETDINAFKLNGTRSASVASTTTTSVFNPSTSIDTDWLFTLRGRLGWAAAPMFLLYVTGGLAVTDATISNSYITTNNPGNTASGLSSTSNTLTGWTIGGGLEWALTQNVSVKAEYLYADFGSISTTTNVISPAFANPNVFVSSVDLKANIVRGGVNFRFGGGPVYARY